MPIRSGLAAFGVLRGRSAAMPADRAVQKADTGQMPQAGLRGVQIVAPRSIIAWAWSPGRSAGVRRAASAVSPGLAAGSGVSTATKTRLQSCSSGTGYYQHATAPSDLAAFFNHIGQDVINKSIYVSK